jgi:hypothetical protein
VPVEEPSTASKADMRQHRRFVEASEAQKKPAPFRRGFVQCEDSRRSGAALGEHSLTNDFAEQLSNKRLGAFNRLLLVRPL